MNRFEVLNFHRPAPGIAAAAGNQVRSMSSTAAIKNGGK